MWKFHPVIFIILFLLAEKGLSQINAGQDTTMCFGDTIQLQATGGINDNYAWLDNGFISDTSVSDPYVYPDETMTFTVGTWELQDNVITNGDFEDGNTGFISDYEYSPGSGGLIPEGTYNVVDDTDPTHPSFDCEHDHTTGEGNMMAINGASSSNEVVWQQTINVLPNTTYEFSTWVASMVSNEPAILQFSINGSLLNEPFEAPTATCVWKQFFAIWESGDNTTAEISIVNQNTASGGNDFILDDISFAGTIFSWDSLTVNVVDSVNIAAHPSDKSVDIGEDVSFQVSAGNVENYQWQMKNDEGGNWNDLSENSTYHNVNSPELTITNTPYDIDDHLFRCVMFNFCGPFYTNSALLEVGDEFTIDPSAEENLICLGESVQLFANASGGSENYTYSWSSSPPGFSSNQENPIVSPLQDITYQLTVDDGFETLSEEISIEVTPTPSVNTGPDASFCGGSYLLDSAEVSNSSSILWQSMGSGYFDDSTLLHTTYFPSDSDFNDGNVKLILTAEGNEPCNDYYADTIRLTFSREQVVDPGNDLDICDTNEIVINNTFFENYDSLLWVTNGSGLLSDAATPTPSYNPSEEDFDNDSVTLTVTAYHYPCPPLSDQKILNLYRTPEISAGADDSICETGTFVPDASAQYYDSLHWNSSGSGTFSSDTTVKPLYTPSDDDIINGELELYFEAFSDNPCPGLYRDTTVLTVRENPQVFVGADTSLCGPVDHVIVHNSAQNYDSLLWTTSGSGTFSGDSLHPVFTPTEEDVAEDTVQVASTAYHQPCPSVSDTMDVTLYVIPLIYIPEDTTICSTDSLDMQTAEVDHYLTISWETNGD
ncbi:MAG: hypothetical protein K9I74_10675, partial [Bacteroidales bacterium]|nr:hypothetical protein [Bacteroidales bacterium]